MIREPTTPTVPAKQYAAAYSAHYASKDLLGALRLSMGQRAQHPDAPEAGFSRTQLQNIVNDVVPADVLLAAQIAMALGRIEGKGPSQAESHIP